MAHRSITFWLTLLFTVWALGSAALCRAQDEPDHAEAASDPEVFELQDRKPAPWYEPPVIRPQFGRPFVLDIKTSEQRFGRNSLPQVLVPGPRGDEFRRVNLRSYGSPLVRTNGLVGPTIRIPQNHDLRIQLTNLLPPNSKAPCNPRQHETPDCFDHTNFHTHGLHISPRGAADNVLITLTPADERADRCIQKPGLTCGTNPDPGCCYRGLFTHRYRVGQDLPNDEHYPGTFWYHAHKHGSTSVQLASGMAGALIVEDPEDSPLAPYRDRVLMLQQLAFDDGTPGQVLPDGGTMRDLVGNWGRGTPEDPVKRYTTINGVAKPGIPMCPGEVQRWRIIDSGVFEMVPIELAWVKEGQDEEPVSARLIAYDGITVKEPVEVFGADAPVEMGPGYRVDLLVQHDPRLQGQGYRLLLRKRAPAKDWTFNGMDGPGRNQILAEVVPRAQSECRPGSYPVRFPTDPLPHPMKDVDRWSGERSVKFTVVERQNKDPLFQINDRTFDHGVHEDFCLPFGGVEQWTLTTETGGATPDVHPFHIHVNAFQVIRDDKPAEWRDTILVKENEPVTIRSRYENFDGRFVLHCHILTHEDRGMMQMVEITRKPEGKCKNPAMSAMSHDESHDGSHDDGAHGGDS